MTDHAYILDAKRTPVGSFQGALSDRTAPELGAHAVKSAVENAGVDPDTVDEVFLGCVVSAGVKQAPARQAMRLAGIPDGVGATTVNKVCGSGMKAAMLATDLIRAQSARCIVAGGMESMSNAPSLMQKARGGLRMGHAELADAMFLDGLERTRFGFRQGERLRGRLRSRPPNRFHRQPIDRDSSPRPLCPRWQTGRRLALYWRRRSHRHGHRTRVDSQAPITG